MQTFLPYSYFYDSAECLDNKRLQKQIVECKQIYLALTEPTYGWKNHPAVKMWAGYEGSLCEYALNCVYTWEGRYHKRHSLNSFFLLRIEHKPFPKWIGDPRFHDSHKSNLYRKDPIHYHKFSDIGPDIPYFWSTKNGY